MYNEIPTPTGHLPRYRENTTSQYGLIANVCSTLYSGKNSRGTSVYTWVSPSNETAFDEDISPLLQYLWRNELVSADARLGLVEFGSETYHSGGNITFSAVDFSLGIWKGDPPDFDLTPIGQDCAKPESPAGEPEKDWGFRTGGSLNGLTVMIATTLSTVVTLRHDADLSTWLAAVVLWRLCLY